MTKSGKKWRAVTSSNLFFSRAFVARRWKDPWIQGARRKMDGVRSVRRSHFSSATQETGDYPPPQEIAREKCGLTP